LSEALWGAVAGYLSLWSVYWLFKLTTGKEGMGYGDFKLLAALGAWLGWQMVLPIVLGSSIIGAVIGIGMKLSSQLREGVYVPYGPFLAGAGLVVTLAGSARVLGWLGWQEGCRLPQREYSSSEIADSMVETAEGLAFGAERTPQEWMNGYEWAMVLDDVGNIRWSYGLPQELNHAYTPGDIAKFARWYLADYPVFCWTEPYGLFVIGLPKGSLWKYSIYSSPDFALSMVRVLPAAALGLLLLGLALCFWLSWRGAKRLETVANGLEALAQGQTVQLPTDGFAGELAEKLNQTGAQLQAKNEMLSRRDNARTQWIAGVSHDVRTPLALILGWAEQLEQDALLPDSSRQKAAGIRTQCEKLRTLIDDLNLTSKLEYGAQPLRRKDLRAGPPGCRHHRHQHGGPRYGY
jgi:hypothetical protein